MTKFLKISGALICLFLLPASVTGAFAAGGAETPLDLASCIKLALEKNYQVRTGAEMVEKAYAQIDESSSSAWPQLDFKADYTRMGNIAEYELPGGETIAFAPENNYKVGLNLSQKIYSPQVFEAIKASKSFAKSAELEFTIVKEAVVSSVKKAYYLYLFTSAMIDVKQESVEQLKRHADDVSSRLEVGLATDYDLLRAEVQLANATPSLTKAKNAKLLAKAALKLTLGIAADSDLSISGALEYQPYEIALKDAQRIASEKRSELHQLGYEIQTLKSYVNVSKKEMLPQLSLHGGYNYANDGVSTGGEAEWDYNWNLGLSLDYKLFDGWEKSSRVSRNRRDLSAANIKREETSNRLKLEVETAFAKIGEARELIWSQEKNIENATRAFSIAEAGNLNGVISQLELMDAQLALTEARSNYTQAVYDWLIAKVQMDRAMGIVMDGI